jgi:hypothetical protein
MKIKRNMPKQAEALYPGLGLMNGSLHADFLNERTFENESAGLMLSLARNSWSEKQPLISAATGFWKPMEGGAYYNTHHASKVWSNKAALHAAIEQEDSAIVIFNQNTMPILYREG